MSDQATKRDVAVSMRFRGDDLGIIDQGAALAGLSRTEFMRRAALHDAQIAILNETLVRLDAVALQEFAAALESPVSAPPPKLRERLSRPAPWLEAPKAPPKP
jgi:uncharacterized protein (DUF1778 family)